ncbi:hypothetical protein P3X46_030622 [Hevea brasiliensis]|uniref:EF-hand domain-containing protein n=1 Tax=Hevea brasiliensis TaxID=3981 RepID=A0ABQ9KJ34_HEVBR|nr:hypothetical protein P3X46_030622 [Hevea brasiliensis]
MSSLSHQANKEELHKMITEFDAEGLNTQGIDTDEVLENLKDAFSIYNIDGNGSMSAQELHKVMGNLGEPCSTVESRKMISGFDSDGDGMINFEEFKVVITVGVSCDSSNGLR